MAEQAKNPVTSSPAQNITLAPDISQDVLRSQTINDADRQVADALHQAQLAARKAHIKEQVASNKANAVGAVNPVTAGGAEKQARDDGALNNQSENETQASPSDPRLARLQQLNALRKSKASSASQKHVPKISTGAAVIVIGWALLLDFITICFIFLALDDFIVTDFLGAPITVYFWWKGSKWVVDGVLRLMELIPYVGTLPLMTIGAIAVIAIDRSPKLSAAMKQVSLKKGKGKIGKK